MRLSKQMLANEVVVLQNSLARLKYEFRTRSYADRDMQIIKREVQRVWHQKVYIIVTIFQYNMGGFSMTCWFFSS